MMRVAIIGNSHVGAYILAREAIESAFPSVSLSFFALPRHSFSSCTYDESGVLHAREATHPNLPHQIDLSSQEAILMVGQSFALDGLAQLIGEFDMLGGQSTGKSRTVSGSLVTSFLDHRVARYCHKLAEFLRNDARCVVVPAPHPATNTPELDTGAAQCSQHPEAPRLLRLWQKTVSHQMSELRYGLMLQPQELTDGPVFSPPRYSRAASLPDGQAPTTADYTHMNEDYGFDHFKAFARHWLGILPAGHPHSPRKEHDHGLGPQ